MEFEASSMADSTFSGIEEGSGNSLELLHSKYTVTCSHGCPACFAGGNWGDSRTGVLESDEWGGMSQSSGVALSPN